MNNNKSILITGGTSGLGLSLVKKFLDLDYQVYVIGKSQTKELENNFQRPLLKVYSCDITDYQSLQNISKQISSLDVLINNAGIFYSGSLEEVSVQKIKQIIDVNLTGQIFVTKTFLNQIKKSKGVIFNVASTSGVETKDSQTIYGASKFGLQGFTNNLAKDLIGDGVKVMGFYPGGMKTDLFKNSGDNRDISKLMDTDHIADYIAFCIQNSDKYILSQSIVKRVLY